MLARLARQTASLMHLCYGLSVGGYCATAWAERPLVAIDVGHHWQASGALSARGRTELSFNLELAGRFPAALQAHELRVQRVNFDGEMSSLAARPAAAVGADLLFSIHHDSVHSAYLQEWQWEGETLTFTDAKRGFGLFVSGRNPALGRSLACASAVGQALREAGWVPSEFHARNRQPADAENGVWFYDNLVVLYRATMPAILFEAGVIKHRDEELELADADRQARMADVVAQALAGCLAVKAEPARQPAESQSE